jgi:hypothetical protein
MILQCFGPFTARTIYIPVVSATTRQDRIGSHTEWIQAKPNGYYSTEGFVINVPANAMSRYNQYRFDSCSTIF